MGIRTGDNAEQNRIVGGHYIWFNECLPKQLQLLICLFIDDGM